MKIAIFCLLASILIIFLQGLHPVWQKDLITDLSSYREKADYFWTNGNITHLQNNEYLPVAVSFFILIFPSYSLHSPASYLYILLAVNILLILVLGILICKNRPNNIYLYSLLLIFGGPIILYRFELLAILFATSSLLCFNKGKLKFSAIFLALSVLTKLYPIIYLPYFLFLTWKQEKRSFWTYLTTFLVTMIGVTFLYIGVMHLNLHDIFVSLSYHQQKPVELESQWTALLSVYYLIVQGHLPHIIGRNLVSGVDDKQIIFPMAFYDYFWAIPISIFYLWLWKIRKQLVKANFVIIFSLTLTFLIFSKLMAPQYLYWALLFIPFFDFKLLKQAIFKLIFAFACLILLLTQILYPLNHRGFIDAFNQGTNFYIYLIFLLESLLMLALLFLSFKLIRKTRN